MNKTMNKKTCFSYLFFFLESLNFLVFSTLISVLSSEARAFDVNACGFTADAPGEYTVTQDLSNDVASACITINSSDVSLDCAGHSITQATPTPASGVLVLNASNASVKNCVVQFFENGVKLDYSNNSLVENNSLNDNTYGILASQSQANVFRLNTVGSNTYGIALFDSSSNQVFENTVNGNDYGVYSTDSHYNVFSSNTVDANGFDGVYFFLSNDNTLSNNSVNNNGKNGVFLYGSYNNVVDGNAIDSNANAGVKLKHYSIVNYSTAGYSASLTSRHSAAGVAAGVAGSVGITAFSNTVSNNAISNGAYGVYVADDQAMVTGNVITGASTAGLVINGYELGFSATVTGNTINENDAGIMLLYARDNVFSSNQIGVNTATGVAAVGSDNNIFTSDVIQNSVNPGTVFLDAASNLTFVNVSFDKTRSYFNDSNSLLTVKWFLNVFVADQYGAPVNNAVVSVYDVNSTQTFTSLTNANGTVSTQTLEYTQNQSNTINYTPHVITAVKNGVSNSTQTQVTQSTTASITLALTPPTISSVTVADVMQNSVVITWVTDYPANETLEYGTSTSYGANYTNPVLATTHSATLVGLTSGVTYHFKILACDANNNCANSSDYVFTTVRGGTTGGTTGGGTTGGEGGGLTVTPQASESSVTPTPSPFTQQLDLGDGASVTVVSNNGPSNEYTVFYLNYSSNDSFTGTIEWVLPLDCSDYLNGLVSFTPPPSSVSCGSIKAVWEVKFLKAGEDFNAKVTVRKQLPASIVNDVKKPVITPLVGGEPVASTVSSAVATLPAVTASTQVSEAMSPVSGGVFAGSNSYWLIGVIIAVLAVAAIAFYARKRSNNNSNNT